jgi:YggT family protein
MAAIILFVFTVISALLSALIFVIIASAILSWLVTFDIVNLRNRFVYQVANFLDGVSRPVLRPVQRIIPPLGGIDISPIIVLVVLSAAQRTLLPALANWLVSLVG